MQATILFPLVDYGANDFEATPVSHASGDTKISKDEGAFGNTTNAFAHEGMGIYSIVLTSTEMEAARIVVTIVDTATKAWEDQAVIISTYGNASAQHEFDLDSATVTPGATALVEIADAILSREISNVDGADFRTLYGAVAKLVNKVAISGGTLTVYETDDSTTVGTQALTTDAAAEPIVAADTA